jgi:hypothetical protein
MHFFNTLRSRISKIVLAAFVIGVLLLNLAAPAMAFGSNASSPSKGLPEMNEMKETSKEVVRKEPRSLEEVQEKAQRGPNSVQGNANLDKMNTPANSQAAQTIPEQAKELLDNATANR